MVNIGITVETGWNAIYSIAEALSKKNTIELPHGGRARDGYASSMLYNSLSISKHLLVQCKLGIFVAVVAGVIVDS